VDDLENVSNRDMYSYLNVGDISRGIGTNSTLEIFSMKGYSTNLNSHHVEEI